MLCSVNIDNDPRYPDKFEVSSNKTASGQTSSKEFIKGETCSLVFGGYIPVMHVTNTTKTFFSVIKNYRQYMHLK